MHVPSWLLLILPFLLPGGVNPMNASPFPFREHQPDGSLTPLLKMTGNTEHHKVVDMHGYTVIEDDNNWFVYATKDPATGRLKSSGLRVGKASPSRAGLPKGLEEPRKMETMRNLRASPSIGLSSPESQQGRRLQITGKLRNLVVLLRFADHVRRPLPSQSDYHILFNRQGGHGTIAPTGSVRDVFRESSFAKLDLTSKITPWITLPYTEKYYANSNSGRTTKTHEALEYALYQVAKMRDINFKDFDVDNDGEIDAITFVHSGYAAEWGGVDCYGGKSNDRIWSHKWYMMSKAFTSQGVRVDRYSVNPGLWHTCGSEIGRIGVIAHEIGHFLGLPDLYDGEGIGRGIGSWDLMSDSWGIDGQQNRPPVMSVWSRAQLGWIEPRVIDTPGQYTVPAVAHTPVAYKITKGFPNGEYLLIENRARIGFDVKIKQPGLAIWHVDENAESPYKMNLNEGFPGQAGWPHNGKHYRVALLQADGNYNLEKGHNSNDRGDLFHGQGVNKLTPSQSNSGPFPNTDSYQGGNIRSSGWWIHDISNAGETMTFKLSDSDPNKPKQMIQTNFSGRKRNAGIMFDVTATKPLTITGMDAHIADTGDLLTVEVYTSTKRTSQAHRKEQLWTKIGSMRVRGKGVGMATPLPAGAFGPVSMRQGERRAFYVTVKEGAELVYGAGGKFNRVYKKNNDLIIREGVGKRYAFKGVDKPRVWNGNIYYQV